MINKLENEKEKDVIIDHRYYRSIIGSKGERIREIREKFNQVQITVPNASKFVCLFIIKQTIFLKAHNCIICQQSF